MPKTIRALYSRNSFISQGDENSHLLGNHLISYIRESATVFADEEHFQKADKDKSKEEEEAIADFGPTFKAKKEVLVHDHVTGQQSKAFPSAEMTQLTECQIDANWQGSHRRVTTDIPFFHFPFSLIILICLSRTFDK